MDFDQDFTAADFGNGNGFEANVVSPAIDGRQHGGGTFLRNLFRGQLLCNGHQGFCPALVPGTIVLVRALSRSQAQRFSEAIFVLRARRKTRSQSQGRMAMWRTKRVVSNCSARMKRDISGISNLTSSEMAFMAMNGRSCACAAR